MFIDTLDVVDVIDGRHAGRRGVIEKIRIMNDGSGYVMVFVQIFNPQTGACDLTSYEPAQLKKAVMRPLDAERMKLLAMVD